MDLIFVDGLDVELGAGCEFELPPYVVRLPDDQMKLACNADNKEFRVVAAGTDPRDGKITMLTATGKVMVFDASKYFIPPGPAEPSYDGLKVFLPNVDGRWPTPTVGFYADSEWLLKNSVSGFVGATIKVNTYQDEDKAK